MLWVLRSEFGIYCDNDGISIQHWWWILGGLVPRFQMRNFKAIRLFELGSVWNSWRSVENYTYFVGYDFSCDPNQCKQNRDNARKCPLKSVFIEIALWFSMFFFIVLATKKKIDFFLNMVHILRTYEMSFQSYDQITHRITNCFVLVCTIKWSQKWEKYAKCLVFINVICDFQI